MTPGTEFHNTIYLHGPHWPRHAYWVEGEPGHAAVDTSGALILIRTPAEANALIAAITEARNLLAERGVS